MEWKLFSGSHLRGGVRILKYDQRRNIFESRIIRRGHIVYDFKRLPFFV